MGVFHIGTIRQASVPSTAGRGSVQRIIANGTVSFPTPENGANCKRINEGEDLIRNVDDFDKVVQRGLADYGVFYKVYIESVEIK
jgi:hypothetical protein